MTLEERIKINDKIKAICPDSNRKVYVTDNWYPSYMDISGKLYVTCYVGVTYYSDEYSVKIVFFGADDFGLEKEFCTSDFAEAIKKYREFKRYAKKVPKNKALQHILYRDGFEMF